MLTSNTCAGFCPARHRLSVYLLLTVVTVLVIAPVVSSDTQPCVCTVFVRESAIPSHLRSHGPPSTTNHASERYSSDSFSQHTQPRTTIRIRHRETTKAKADLKETKGSSSSGTTYTTTTVATGE